MTITIESRSLEGLKKALTFFDNYNYYVMDKMVREEERFFHPSHLRKALDFIQEQERRPDGAISQFSEAVSRPDFSDGVVACKQDSKGKPYYTTKIGCAPLNFTAVPDVLLHEGMVFVTSDGELDDNKIYPSIEDAKNSIDAENPRVQEAIDAVEVAKGKVKWNDGVQSFIEWRDADRVSPYIAPTKE